MLIIARTYIGGKDLYCGVPNLKGATIVDVHSHKDMDTYSTVLVIQDKDNREHTIMIKQDIEG